MHFGIFWFFRARGGSTSAPKSSDISSLRNIVISDFCYFFVTVMLPGFPCSDRDSVIVSPRMSYFNRVLYHSGELAKLHRGPRIMMVLAKFPTVLSRFFFNF